MDKFDYDHKLLQQTREEKFTQAKLAELLSCSPETISRAERGVSASYKLLFKMATAIGLPISQLLRCDEAQNGTQHTPLTN